MPDHQPNARFKRRLPLAKEYLDVEPIMAVVRSRPQIPLLAGTSSEVTGLRLQAPDKQRGTLRGQG